MIPTIICFIALASLALVVHIVHVMQPRKLTVTVKLLPVPTLSVEAESSDTREPKPDKIDQK